jgi:hypothetical protein
MATFELREIPKISGYFAGSDGHIYSFWGRGPQAYIDRNRVPRKLASALCGSDYLQVRIGKKALGTNGAQTRLVHVLVCSAFHGERPDGETVSHKNGMRTDNRPSNLLWENCSANLARRKEHGTDDRGTRNSRARLNDEELAKMRRILREKEYTHAQIGNMFNVTRVFVTKVANNYRYAEVQ